MVDFGVNYIKTMLVNIMAWLDQILMPYLPIIGTVFSIIFISRFILLPIFGGRSINLGSDSVSNYNRRQKGDDE